MEDEETKVVCVVCKKRGYLRNLVSNDGKSFYHIECRNDW
jgi:hypothetical protein